MRAVPHEEGDIPEIREEFPRVSTGTTDRVYYLEDHESAKIEERARSEMEYTQMIHTDLPRMADVGYVLHEDGRSEYDPSPLLNQFLDGCRSIEYEE